MKPKAWSYSALNSFNTCPRQYYEMNVAKNYPYVQGEEAKWGDMVHKALEDHVKGIKDVDTTNLPESIKFRFREILDGLKGYALTAEGKVSLTRDLKPCTFFAKDTWVRGIIDLLGVHGDGAVVVDYKTGKVKPDNKQLKLFALFVFYKYPKVNEVTTLFEWLAYNQATRALYLRDQIPELWMEFIPDLNRFKEAFNKNKWPEKPSGLCSKWCDVLACKHNGRR